MPRRQGRRLGNQAFITFTDNGTVTTYESEGITSIARTTTGSYTITVSSAFRSANSYVVSGISNGGSGATQNSWSENANIPNTSTAWSGYNSTGTATLVNAYRGRLLFTEI